MSSRSSEKPVTVYGAMAANFGIAVTKFIAAAFTGSSAMLSEGIHSLVDTGNQILLLLGIRLSKKPADEKHPFGYGKEVYFWGLIVAILLFGIGGGMSVYEGIIHMKYPHEIGNPVFKGEPRLLYHNGEFLRGAMVAERVTEEEVLQAVRNASKGSISEVEAVVLETDGEFSVIPRSGEGASSILSNVSR
jgi:hypothetical protein